MPEVDGYGHLGGPDSTEVEESLKLIDEFVGDVLSGLDDRNLSGITDVIVLSDHGMSWPLAAGSECVRLMLQ